MSVWASVLRAFCFRSSPGFSGGRRILRMAKGPAFSSASGCRVFSCLPTVWRARRNRCHSGPNPCPDPSPNNCPKTTASESGCFHLPRSGGAIKRGLARLWNLQPVPGKPFGLFPESQWGPSAGYGGVLSQSKYCPWLRGCGARRRRGGLWPEKMGYEAAQIVRDQTVGFAHA